MKVIEDKRIADVVSMFNAGFSFLAIAQQLHVQERRVRLTIDTLGLTRKLKRGGMRAAPVVTPKVAGKYDALMNEPRCAGHFYSEYLKIHGLKKHSEHFSRLKENHLMKGGLTLAIEGSSEG